MFTPLIEVKANNDSTEITIVDVTGKYSPLTNLNGWGTLDYCGVVNPNPFTGTSVISINYRITDTGTSTLIESGTIPISNIPSTINGPFDLATIPFAYSYGEFTVDVDYVTTSCTITTNSYSFITTIGNSIVQGAIKIEAFINVCLSDKKCKTLSIDETTLEPLSNPQGWVVNPGLLTFINGQVLKRLYIEVLDINNTIVDTIVLIENDVTVTSGTTATVTNTINEFPTAYTGPFSYPKKPWAQEDGYYKFVYKAEVFRIAQDNFFVEYNTIENFFYCNAQNCVTSLWLKYVNSDKCNNKKAEEKALQAQLLLDAVKASLTCLDAITSTDIMKMLNKICKLSTVDCGCN